MSIPSQKDERRPSRRRVAVLGATGAVGQTFIRLLENHPWFELAEVAASERSASSRSSFSSWPIPIAACTSVQR